MMDAMDETCDEPAAVTPDLVGSNGTAYRPRGYQLEMLEASLQQNIIVAVSRLVFLLCIGLVMIGLDGYRKWQDSYVCRLISTGPAISMD